MASCVRHASPKAGPEDQGYREAKAVVAFSGHDVAEVSKERHEILHKILQAQITDSETFPYDLRRGLSPCARRAGGRSDRLGRWGALDLEYGGGPAAARRADSRFQSCQTVPVGGRQADLWRGLSLRRALGEGTRNLLLEDKVVQVLLISSLPRPCSGPRYHSALLSTESGRMRYGTYRQRGYFIGSGAIESAGKQLAAGRIKGPGMRWNVTEVNALLKLRCVFLEQSWQTYWATQGPSCRLITTLWLCTPISDRTSDSRTSAGLGCSRSMQPNPLAPATPVD